jgi:ParB-like chromosome segregation protein Spo0J
MVLPHASYYCADSADLARKKILTKKLAILLTIGFPLVSSIVLNAERDPQQLLKWESVMSDENQVVNEAENDDFPTVSIGQRDAELMDNSENGEVEVLDQVDGEAEPEVTPKKSETVRVIMIDPMTVDVDDPFNGRHFPPEKWQIDAMVKSIRERGQLQAVRARKATASERKKCNKEWKLLFGFIRTHALVKLRSEDPNWKLKVEVVKDVNPQDAFVQNLIENKSRQNTNPIDDAYNISRLINDFGWDTKKVQLFYGWSASQVSIIRRLKGLDELVQRKVAKGTLAPSEAVKLLKLAPEAIKEVVDAIPDIQPPPELDYDPEEVPFDDSGSNESIHPPVSKTGKRKMTPEEQAEATRKTNQQYQKMQDKAKRIGKAAVKKATSKAGTVKNTRSIAELKAALSGREDRMTKALFKFINEEWNEHELNQEFDEIEDALADLVDKE